MNEIATNRIQILMYSEKKNVLMIVQSTYPNDSRVRRETETLIENNFNVTIICLRNPDQKYYEEYEDNRFIYRIQIKKNDENIFDYLVESIKFFIKAFYYSIKISISKKIDIVQVHNLPDYLVFSSIIFKLKKIPIILDLHDLTPELFKSKWGNKYKILYNLSKRIEKLSCWYADQVITTSNGFKEKLIERGIEEKKISIILNTPSKFIKRGLPVNFRKINQNLKIIYHGTIAHRFGLHIVIQAMPLIIKEIPGTIFHLYGGGDSDYINYLRNLIKELRLEKNVNIFSSLIHEEIVLKIQNYDIGVVPYLDDEFMQLALSTKSFEYAKLFIPMVASTLKPIKYYFDEEAVIYFSPGDPNDLAVKIVYLAKNENLMNNISENAFMKVQKLSDGSTEREYIKLVNHLLS